MLCVLIRIASLGRFWWVHSTYHVYVEDEIISLNYPRLLLDLVLWLTRSDSNYSGLEQISQFVVPKMFEPTNFDSTEV